MLTSLAMIFLLGLSLASLAQRMKLPRIIGMLATGIILGPYALGLLDASILSISADLRTMALIIILIKAGLSLNISDLKKVGRPALLMSCVPALFEISAFVLFAPTILGITRTEASVMGAVLAAVSPAVVVPRMIELMEEGYGTDKRIPQMILAGASLDDVFVIVLFSTFVRMAQGGSADASGLAAIPVSIVLGLALGALVGFILSSFFEMNFSRRHLVRNSTKVIIMLGTSFFLIAAEHKMNGIIPVSGLLAVMSMALVTAMRSISEVRHRLQEKYGKLWIAAEVVLFVLVGAAVDIRYTLEAGPGTLLMIALGLAFRSIGVCLSTAGCGLSLRERAACVIAYLPKATVQAAIGSVPLSLGLPCGRIVLSAAVLSIIVTAPIGAAGIDIGCRRLLSHSKE